ncbi:hypothetical protein, partial [Spongiibacter sp. UBA6593]|uniref:hypothetical protein n=1 Tax=Spongiibacter sp. UBA6593 TaxID=1947544 RepID=UPI00257979F8
YEQHQHDSGNSLRIHQFFHGVNAPFLPLTGGRIAAEAGHRMLVPRAFNTDSDVCRECDTDPSCLGLVTGLARQCSPDNGRSVMNFCL